MGTKKKETGRLERWVSNLFSKKWWASLFSTDFIHPDMVNRLDTAVDHKIAKVTKDQEKDKEKYRVIMKNYVHAFFSKKYTSVVEEQVAFDVINKDWKKLVRRVNSTHRFIQLSKTEFERQVKFRYEWQIDQQKKNKEKQKNA